MRARPVHERIEGLMGPADENGCRVWLGAVSQRGTPSLSITKGQSVSARRALWEHTHGPLPSRKQFVSLSCGNKACMTHLVLREHDPKKRFWEYVDKSAGPDGCWIWTGGVQKGGYGGFRINPTKTMRAQLRGFKRIPSSAPTTGEFNEP